MKTNIYYKGFQCFNFFLNQFESLLLTSAKQKNPGLWLYQNNARTPLFMLEGLAKMYMGIHNPKKFSKMKEQFKLLEDVLGAIDYYDAFAKEFISREKIPAAVTAYLQAQTREKIQSLNELLKDMDWLSEGNSKIKKIRKKLAEADWMKEKEAIHAINAFYGRSIYEIVEFAKKSKLHFNTIDDVHELRRRLRWLSIYPQVARGSIQLGKNKIVPEQLSKYLTPEITGSPFNIMPDAGNAKYFLLLEQNYFFALSWMIAELGRLKDSGLRIIAIKEALQQLSAVNDETAYEESYSYAGPEQPKLEDRLKKAEDTCKSYFDGLNLEHLVMGIHSANPNRKER